VLILVQPGFDQVAHSMRVAASIWAMHSGYAAPLHTTPETFGYAMHVEEVLSLEEYDRQAPKRWPHRIPNLGSADMWDRLGDCIYDYSKGRAWQRPSVHSRSNIATDLSGENALISRDFYYLGKGAIRLPNHLLPICHQTQGHRSESNAQYFLPFVDWIRKLPLVPGQMHGWPDFTVDWEEISSGGGCLPRRLDGENDRSC